MKNFRSSLLFGIGVALWILMITVKAVLVWTGHEFGWDNIWVAVPIVLVILGASLPDNKPEDKHDEKKEPDDR